MFNAIGVLLWDRLWQLCTGKRHLYQLCVLCVVSFVSGGYWEVLESTSLVGLL